MAIEARRFQQTRRIHLRSAPRRLPRGRERDGHDPGADARKRIDRIDAEELGFGPARRRDRGSHPDGRADRGETRRRTKYQAFDVARVSAERDPDPHLARTGGDQERHQPVDAGRRDDERKRPEA